MKRILPISIALAFSVLIYDCSNKAEPTIFEVRNKYQKFIDDHEFSRTPLLNKAKLKAMPKQDRPDLAWEQDFLRTMDPATGKPERQRLIPTIEAINDNLQQSRVFSSQQWDERGPYQVGGRTRAIMFDPNDGTAKKCWPPG